jgi:organic radical activating enzyme
MTTAQLLYQVKKYPCKRIVITGGEPMLQQEGIYDFCNALPWYRTTPYEIEIETNGTIGPKEHIFGGSIVISPKLLSSGGPGFLATDMLCFMRRCVETNTRKISLKFVIGSSSDLQEMEEFFERYKYELNYDIPIYLMPQCTSVGMMQDILPMLIEYAKKHKNFIVTPRLQILAYGNKRGT